MFMIISNKAKPLTKGVVSGLISFQKETYNKNARFMKKNERISKK